ncbi:MAG: efflux RND transporter periplasmic adaptor subunit [Chloroflexia bacterium]|nr:efflux RND transporter periplasmic adaptor subunit [Chloroflexia bacterium]
MKIKVSILAIGVAGTLLLSACGHNRKEEAQKAKYVKVEQVFSQKGGGKLVFNGQIKEKSLSTLSFRIGGPLVRFNVKTGDYVQKGQIIAAIDQRDYQLQVQSTKAQYEQVKGEYARYKELHDKNKIPANSYEKVESGYLMAKTAYENAVNQLRDTELRAPFSGYIYEKMVENFQTVGPGVPIVSIIDVSSLEAVISVPENQILNIKRSSDNYLNVKNANVSNLPVSIVSIGEKAKQDGLYEVKLSFANSKELNISPGMSAEVTMYCKGENVSNTIPASAVFYKDNKTCVWLYNTGTKSVSQKEIEVKGIISDGKIEVSGGLGVGDSIVTTGVNSLSEGQTVEPIQKPAYNKYWRVIVMLERLLNQKALIWAVLFAVFAGGIFSYLNIGKLEDAEIPIKSAMVITVYPGATAHEVELEVTDVLEKAIQKLENVKEIESVSEPGISKITINIQETVKTPQLPQLWDHLRRKVNDAKGSLPAGAYEPIVNDDFADVYGMLYAVSAEGFSLPELEEYTEFIEKELLEIDGVKRSQIFGRQTETVDVIFSPEKLASLNINPLYIAMAMQNQSQIVNPGSITIGKEAVRVGVGNKIGSMQEIEDLLIQVPNGGNFRLAISQQLIAQSWSLKGKQFITTVNKL